MTTILGTSNAVPKSTKRKWDRQGGETYTQPYEGADAAILSLYNTLKANAEAGLSSQIDVIEYDPGKGKAALTVQYATAGKPVYEMFSNEFSKSVKQHPYFTTTAPALTGAEITDVENAFQAATSLDASGFAGKQLELLTMLNMGIEEYYVSGYVLRETKVVGWSSTVTMAYTDVNKVVAAPSMSGAVTLIDSLPSGGEWLYKSPIVRTIGPRKWQVVREWWWLPTWSKILYGGTGTP